MHFPLRFLASLFLFSLFYINCLATAAITTATGGLNISADKSAGSGSAAFTSLGNIVISSVAAADFTTGNNLTFVLTTPANWQFQSGTGTATAAGNITIISTVVTGTTVTVTYNAGANSTANTLTISGLQVQATAQTLLAAANITRTSGTGVIAGFAAGANVGQLSQVAGTFTRLQLLLPGETTAPGTATGKTGTPMAQVAGTAFNVTVNAVDANWNKVASITDVTNITSTDVNGVMPANAALVAGTKTNFAVNLKTAGTYTITATDITAPAITASISPSVTVNTGAFTKLQILLPGETAAPGTATGKTGTPTAPVAGAAFNIQVNAVDAVWNVVTSVTDVTAITSNDANAVLPANTALTAGTQTLSFTYKTATTTRTITASDVTTSAKTANTSPTVAVAAAAFAKLQLLMPGEVAAAGSASGKTGTPNAAAAGTAFTVTINAVDAYWNKVTTITDLVAITSNDAAGTTPANAALVAGTKTFSVTLKTPTTAAVITATDVTDGTKTANSSPTTVNIGAFVKLQLLLPGETAAPGTTTGKTGTPTAQTAGSSFTVTVNAVDAVWNLVTSSTDVVTFVSTDANAALPANAPLAGGTSTFVCTFKTAGAKTLTAKDFTSTTKTQSASPTVTVTPDLFVKLQLLLPGETAAPGTAAGKTGTPTAQSAGTAFNTIVNAVDANWNKVTTVTDVITFTTTDANATVPANAALVAGTKTNFAVNLKTPGTATITAADFTDGSKTVSTSPAVTVNIGGFVKLQLLLPGETAAPGTTTGKTGTPTAPVAGVPFNIVVNAVDAAWNVVTSVTDIAGISSNDLNAVLPVNTPLVSGTKTLSFTFKTATTTRTVTATDITNGAKTTSTSPSVTVVAGAYSQLQVLLPGETAAPGTIDGKSGTANPPARGTAFNIIVNAVDANFNKVTTVTNTVAITSSDGGATLPAAAALVAGTKTLSVKIISNATSPLPTLTATDAAISVTVNVPGNLTPTATTDYFRSKTSGNWNDASIWESSVNGTTGWQDATLTPTSAANTISILNTHVVTVTASVTADQIVVQTGGQLVVNSGLTLTIASGGATINGTITNAGTITPTGTLTFQSGGKYQHNFTTAPGTIPAATWDNQSTCEIIGYTSNITAIGGISQTFGNFTWNCPNQNVAGSGISLGGTVSVNDLTITSTGASTGTLQLGTAGGTVTVRGNFYQTGGTLVLNNTATGTENLNIKGDFNISGGTIKTTGGNLISFAGTSTQNYLKTGGAFTGAVNFAVNSNATVNFGASVIDGTTGTFTLNTGGTMLTDNDNGVTASGATGTIQCTGTRTFSTNGNYVFSGTNAQIIGNGLPATVNNLTVNNSQGVSMPAGSASYTITGTLSLTNGNLDMGSNTLVAGTGFTNTGTGILRTQNTSTVPLPAGKTWNVGVEYYGSSPQTVVSGTYTDLLFSSSGIKTVAGGTITVNGNWSSSNGKVDLLTNNATVQFTGSSQSLNDDGTDNGNGILFKNVTFGNSGTKTLATGSYSIAPSGLLTMAGTAVLAVNGNLTILSTATGTGNIGPLTSGAITGNVNVQSFITGGNDLTYRGYRLISSPVSLPSAPNTYCDFSFLRGSGTYITGSGGATNGFDVAGSPTLYLYREDALPNANYRAVTKINNSPTYKTGTVDGDFNMPVGNGLLFFFRGNNGTNSGTPPSDVVLSTSGRVNQGQIIVKNWFNYGSSNLAYSTPNGSNLEGFNLVGNPYPCSIDWNTAFSGTMSNGIYAPNTDQTIYIYNATSKNYATYLNTGANTGTGTNGGTNIIPSGQGFFVHATTTGAQLVFNESAKVNAHPTSLLLNAATPTVTRQMRLQLSKDSINKDENVFVFNDAALSGYRKNEDALYLKGSGAVSLSNLSTDNRALAINQLPFSKQTQVIPLNVTVNAAGIYKLSLTELSNIPQIYDVWLKDAYKNDSLDIKANKTYSFNVTGDAATAGANRFKLVIRPRTTLVVHLLDFTTSKATGNVKISWTSENEADYTHYFLERSVDGGKTFSVLDSLTSAGWGTYNDLDPSPVSGQNLYRLKQIDVFGNATYSTVVTVMYAPAVNNTLVNSNISVYPNPVSSVLNLAITPVDKTITATYKITVTNTSGIVVKSTTSSQAAWQGDVSGLLPGTYFVQVINTTNNSVTGKSSFIKL
ncbi:T9SS type A sorting domain-containing protein [Mucilaginibacter sp. UR6-11]|uniref:T9SS type A sorting domain-containing protein n=1 Tax=Mucilaginibacter sp. UR6-11 TaxID=1435644 RepID=UPI001E2B5E43|nr:T9SS type A sorting domain-containing protein [Mucilaginibacter sp. UR6-11]MCC8425096.1 T9SS type A sorting domain-containing protein [Mucilaginibacter sp. UR6-11]